MKGTKKEGNAVEVPVVEDSHWTRRLSFPVSSPLGRVSSTRWPLFFLGLNSTSCVRQEWGENSPELMVCQLDTALAALALTSSVARLQRPVMDALAHFRGLPHRMEPVASVTLHITSMCRMVMMSSSLNIFLNGISSVSTMPNPENIAPATK